MLSYTERPYLRWKESHPETCFINVFPSSWGTCSIILRRQWGTGISFRERFVHVPYTIQPTYCSTIPPTTPIFLQSNSGRILSAIVMVKIQKLRHISSVDATLSQTHPRCMSLLSSSPMLWCLVSYRTVCSKKTQLSTVLWDQTWQDWA
jgi:hypothetical protein